MALATEESKTALEDSVSWYLADRLTDPAMPIATKKYMTGDNLLVYLTRCNVAESAVPRVKVQVLRRVDGGVHETGYQLYGDHRFEKYQNAMIFGGQATEGAADAGPQQVTQEEAGQLLQLLSTLQSARQTL